MPGVTGGGTIAKPSKARITVYLILLAIVATVFVMQRESTRHRWEQATADRVAVEQLLSELGDPFNRLRVYVDTRPRVHVQGPVPTVADADVLWERIEQRLGPNAEERVSIGVTPEAPVPPTTSAGADE